MIYRTHHLNELNHQNIAEKVILSGWVLRRRDHGGLIFIDLRDREGLTQIVFNPKINKNTHQLAENLKSQYVITVSGTVRERPSDMINTKLPTGEIEVVAEKLEIINPSQVLPFEIDDQKEVNEELRLNFRYLDLRRPKLQKNIMRRHQIIKFIRDYFDQKGFIEIETPILIKGTPEGSREYIVPSRLYPEKFYVLPQSPQQLKQLLMVAGFDKYMQIARCFRDEDQRGDRQPEFTQLDLEMSFITQDDILKVNEECLIKLTEKFLPHQKILKTPFPRLTYHQALEKFGSDKPDMRFGFELDNLSHLLENCGFKIFEDTIQKGGIVKALKIENGANLSRSEIDGYEQIAKAEGAKGLSYLILEDQPKSPILKFLDKKTVDEIFAHTHSHKGDLIFFVADKFEIACTSLGKIRLAYGKKFNLIPHDLLAFLWVTDFPLFEWSKEENKLVSCHHPFTHPHTEDLELLDRYPEKARAIAYDVILNGVEIGGGSIRIHDPKLQNKIFDLLQINDAEAQRRFGHLLKAFTYGAPPHGGIAWGLDRIIMLFQDEANIREVIAFPKDQKARDLMTGAPSILPKAQIEEVHIKTINCQIDKKMIK